MNDPIFQYQALAEPIQTTAPPAYDPTTIILRDQRFPFFPVRQISREQYVEPFPMLDLIMSQWHGEQAPPIFNKSSRIGQGSSGKNEQQLITYAYFPVGVLNSWPEITDLPEAGLGKRYRKLSEPVFLPKPRPPSILFSTLTPEDITLDKWFQEQEPISDKRLVNHFYTISFVTNDFSETISNIPSPTKSFRWYPRQEQPLFKKPSAIDYTFVHSFYPPLSEGAVETITIDKWFNEIKQPFKQHQTNVFFPVMIEPLNFVYYVTYQNLLGVE